MLSLNLWFVWWEVEEWSSCNVYRTQQQNDAHNQSCHHSLLCFHCLPFSLCKWHQSLMLFLTGWHYFHHHVLPDTLIIDTIDLYVFSSKACISRHVLLSNPDKDGQRWLVEVFVFPLRSSDLSMRRAMPAIIGHKFSNKMGKKISSFKKKVLNLSNFNRQINLLLQEDHKTEQPCSTDTVLCNVV